MPPARYDIALDLSRLNHVLAYEPRDLTLGVEPGMKFSALAATLAGEKQLLPLNPPFMSHATIGGILAADSPSPLRHLYGGPRDFVLGLEFVTGDGAIAKSGGRVVKNVSGYDLHKLLIGSLGTLAVITRANFKTFPMPPEQVVFVVAFDDAAAALNFCATLVRSPLGALQVDVISPDAAQYFAAQPGVQIALPEKHVRCSFRGGTCARRGAASQRITYDGHAIESKRIGCAGRHHAIHESCCGTAGRVREFPALHLDCKRCGHNFPYRGAAFDDDSDCPAIERVRGGTCNGRGGGVASLWTNLFCDFAAGERCGDVWKINKVFGGDISGNGSTRCNIAD